MHSRQLDPPRRAGSLWPGLLLLVAALGSLALADWHAMRGLAQVSEVTDERARARNARLYLAQALSLHQELEIGVRGFVITGQEAFLAPYLRAREAMPAVHEEIRASLDTAPAVQVGLRTAERLAALRAPLLEQTVALRRERGLNVLEEERLFAQGKASMDAIRDEFARLDAHQVDRVNALHAQVQSLGAEAQRASVLAISLGLLLATVALVLLWRERQLRLGAETALLQANAELDQRVGVRTAALDAARAQIAAFAADQNSAIEAERRRLAREVHDQIGQVFTAISLIVSGLPARALQPRQAQALDEALKQGVATSRRITAELRPPLLDELGLAAALRHHAPQRLEPAGLQGVLDVQQDERLSPEQALALFRIVQEALTNVLRHAQASRVDIRGGLAPDGQHYRLTVEDDGRGFTQIAARPGALGLTGMRERAAWHGGHCEWAVPAGGGTLVAVTLPLLPSDEVPAG